jgi:hypothetical protein
MACDHPPLCYACRARPVPTDHHKPCLACLVEAGPTEPHESPPRLPDRASANLAMPCLPDRIGPHHHVPRLPSRAGEPERACPGRILHACRVQPSPNKWCLAQPAEPLDT